MAGIPTNFQSLSPVIANYDFVDIASGTGYINFYAGNTVDDTILSNFSYYSDVMWHSGSTSSGSYALVIDLDFDTTLNRPLDLKGLGIVNIPFCLADNNSSDYGKVVVTLRKWDGATETDIVSNESREFTAVGTFTYTMLAVDLNIPLTHFKIGETLRLTIQGYGKTSGNSVTYQIANDPKNRTTNGTMDWDLTGEVQSQLIFQCPVRLNL